VSVLVYNNVGNAGWRSEKPQAFGPEKPGYLHCRSSVPMVLITMVLTGAGEGSALEIVNYSGALGLMAGSYKPINTA
jgi:hypothetical protein